MKTIVNALKAPHPAHDNFTIYLRHISLIAFLVFWILWLFTPFSFPTLSSSQRLTIAALYATGGFLFMLINFLPVLAFPVFFADRNWNLGKEILMLTFQISSIAVMVWLVSEYIVQWPHKTINYWKAWGVAMTAGLLPYLVATMFKHVYLLRKNIQESQVLNQLLPTQVIADTAQLNSEMIEGLGVPVAITDFLYAECKANYLSIYLKHNEGVAAVTQRMTAKQFLVANAQFSCIFRCHKAFIINLKNILNVSGNAAGYQITVHPMVSPIHVSRHHASAFKTAMKHLRD